MASKAA